MLAIAIGYNTEQVCLLVGMIVDYRANLSSLNHCGHTNLDLSHSESFHLDSSMYTTRDVRSNVILHAPLS